MLLSAITLSCLQMLQNYDLGKVPGFGSSYSESLWHFNVVVFCVFFFPGVDVPISCSCTL